MPYQDSDVRGGKVSLKTSMTAGETIAASGQVEEITPEEFAAVFPPQPRPPRKKR